MRYLVGTRGSRLSLAQTDLVISRLKQGNPDADYEIVRIATKGDADSRPLFAIDQKGIFEREVDRAVADGRVHFAVHSLKDVPSDLPRGLTLASVPKREPPNDVLVTRWGLGLDMLPSGAVVGTSSLRRAVQVRRSRPDIRVVPVRGNVETRIQKTAGELDGVVLAFAGLSRLGLDAKHAVLSIKKFLPSPGQGALALVARKEDAGMIQMLRGIEDADSRLSAEAERALSDAMNSGCRFPIGAYAWTEGGDMHMRANAFSVDGKASIQVARTGRRDDPRALGALVVRDLEVRGAKKLALNWRRKVEEWNQE